ncbi:hypothetical protein SDC9_149975 [bioreactor metagenome]|uniref:Uncharacterized protein n=1 Tax=bioreactor metagenome TaxID=1076179 RepID=A0A645ENQ1_9ZZZZ
MSSWASGTSQGDERGVDGGHLDADDAVAADDRELVGYVVDC